MMYENLIETLRFCAKNGDCHDCPYEKPCAGSMGDGLYCEAADAIEELQRAQELWITQERNALLKSIPRWVSVEDKLPEPWEPVLVTYLGYNSHLPKVDMLAYIDSDDGSWYWWDDTEPSGTKCIVTITHWIPLPEPPKEGAK